MTQVEQINVKRCHTDDELTAVQQLRHIVLDPARPEAAELHVSAKDRDPRNIIMGAYAGGVLVSTVRLDALPDSNWYVVRKMATLPTFRGLGFGRKVLEEGEAAAIASGATGFTLDSRHEAVPFYARLGYTPAGRQVMHTPGIPNYTMFKLAEGRQ